MTKVVRRLSVLGVVAMGALGLAAQEGFVLRLVLTEGATDTYEVVTTTTETLNLPNDQGKVDFDGTLVSAYKVKTGKVDGDLKAATMEIGKTISKITSVGELASMYRKKTVGQTETYRGTLNDRGLFKKDVPEGEKDPLNVSISDPVFFIELPERVVKVGDSWDMTLPISGSNTAPDLKVDFKGKSKLVEERNVGGKAALVISSEGTLKLEADATSLVKDTPGFPEGQKAFFKGAFQFKTDSLIEKASGRALRSTSKVKGNVKIEIPSHGVIFDMSPTSTSVGTLVAK